MGYVGGAGGGCGLCGGADDVSAVNVSAVYVSAVSVRAGGVGGVRAARGRDCPWQLRVASCRPLSRMGSSRGPAADRSGGVGLDS